MNSTVLLVQLACALYMSGVIWVVQLIHYPAFLYVNPGEFRAFHARHSRMMGWIVGPVMVAELTSALWLARDAEAFWIFNLALVIGTWFATFYRSVPLHNLLAQGRNPAALESLVRTNWVRTALWSIHALALLVYVGAK